MPNVNSYAFIGGLSQSTSSDSPLGGDNLMDVAKANDIHVQQYQARRSCSTKGSNHGAKGSYVVYVDGHGDFNPGGDPTKLDKPWKDATGGTANIKNPNGL